MSPSESTSKKKVLEHKFQIRAEGKGKIKMRRIAKRKENQVGQATYVR